MLYKSSMSAGDTPWQTCTGSSESSQAEILLKSPRKLFIFIIKKYNYGIKVSKKISNLALKKARTGRASWSCAVNNTQHQVSFDGLNSAVRSVVGLTFDASLIFPGMPTISNFCAQHPKASGRSIPSNIVYVLHSTCATIYTETIPDHSQFGPLRQWARTATQPRK